MSPFPGRQTPHTPIFLLQIRRLAALCIQKNLAVFLKIKDWPWWGLLASLRPLLSSTLSTEQLRAKEVGLVVWVVTRLYPALRALVNIKQQLGSLPLICL